MFSDVFLSGHWTGIQAKTWVQVQIFFELQISNQVMGWMITITLNDNYVFIIEDCTSLDYDSRKN